MLKLQVQYRTRLGTLVVCDKVPLTLTIMMPSMTHINDPNGKVAETLTKPFLALATEQQLCITQLMLHSARC